MIERNRSILIAGITVILLTAVACATQQQQVTIGRQGEKAIAIKADNFKFEPNNLKAAKGDEIIFRIENVSGAEHDFTVKDPLGNKIKSVDLPSKKTTTVKVEFPKTGTYEFYCDKPLHSSLGMKGRILVE